MATDEQIDEQLAAWDERLRRIDESLLALEGDATWQLVAPGGRLLPTVEGATRAEVEPAVDAMARLFEDRERLVAIVERAKELRASMSALVFWQSDDKLAEIDALLRGPSITVGAEATPLSRRSLLDPGPREVSVSPEALLERMTQAFERTRDLTARLSRAFAKLEPALEELEKELDLARRDRALLEGDDAALAALESLARAVAEQRTRVARDPLGVDGSLREAIEPELAALRDRLSTARALRSRVHGALVDADASLRTLREAHAAARDAYDVLAREVKEPAARAAPKPDAEIADLARWLGKLRDTVAAGRLSSADVGLARFRDACEAALADAREAARIAAKSLAVRDELRGRASARRAQLEAFAARGVALGGELVALAREASELVSETPTDVGAARVAVEALDAAVHALRRA